MLGPTRSAACCRMWPCRLVNDDDRVLPPGEAGAIRLRSPGMARSVYGASTSSAGDSFKGGWAYPGDIGAIDGDGFLHLLGRTSDLIIRGGANVHPSEIEVVIRECERSARRRGGRIHQIA